jgi:tetratricopeptide (TPR) repeat protein
MNSFAPWCRFAVASCVLALSSAALAQSSERACGSLENAYGPFDYRTAGKAKLQMVERYHFTPEVESLLHGKSSSRIGSDLDYTLRAFPNHHRALLTLIRYGQRARSPQPADLPKPVECYFDRALRFRPDDTLARMIYAQFLVSSRRPADATRQLEIAKASAGDDGFTHYNIGLIYFDLKNYPRALEQAQEAARLGFVKAELKDKLVAAGHWDDPAASAPAAAASAAASAPQ